MIKKILFLCFAFLTCLSLTGCSSSQGKIANKIDDEVNHLQKIVNTIELINEDDINVKEYQSTSKKISIEKNNEILSASSTKTIECNNKTKNIKNEILETCNLLKALTRQLRKNEIKISNSKISGCQECLANLSETTNKISISKYDVSRDLTTVSKTIKNKKVSSDVLSSKFIKLSNTLESRLSSMQNALNLLNQMKCLISGTCSENSSLLDEKNNQQQTNTLLDYVIDKFGNKHETYCDREGNCYTPKCDSDGNCYYTNQDGQNYPVKCKDGVCFYPKCQNGVCGYYDKNGNCLSCNENSSTCLNGDCSEKTTENKNGTQNENVVNENSVDQKDLANTISNESKKDETNIIEKNNRNQQNEHRNFDFEKDRRERHKNIDSYKERTFNPNIDSFKKRKFNKKDFETNEKVENEDMQLRTVDIYPAPLKPEKLPKKITGNNINVKV